MFTLKRYTYFTHQRGQIFVLRRLCYPGVQVSKLNIYDSFVSSLVCYICHVKNPVK